MKALAIGLDYPQTGSNSRNQPPILAFRPISPNRPRKKRANQPIMLTPVFLRRQAENCLRIARSCFDLASAERLRLMAAELNAKAAEMDEQDPQDRWPRTIEPNPPSS
jgi:hypothetical protein